MAVSGNQKTRIAGYYFGSGKKLTILPKTPSVVTTTLLNYGRGLMRAINRGLSR